MTKFNFDTSYYFSSLDNLNQECRNYTDSEIKYKELITKYENEIYNKALADLWKIVIQKYDEFLSLEELDECLSELKAQGRENWERIEREGADIGKN